MAEQENSAKHPWGKHRYTSVVEGCAMAAQYRRSGLTIGEFVRQTGVTRRMVLYWTQRERELAATAHVGFTEVPPAIEVAVHATEPPPPEACSSLPAMPVSVVAGSVPPTPPAALEVRLPGGATIVVGQGFDPALLRAVVGCLASSC